MTPPLTVVRHAGGRAALAVRIAAMALASCGMLAACGSPVPAARPTTTVTVHASPPTTRPATTSPATSPAPVSATAAGPAGCLASALRASLGASQGTAGTFYQVVVLTNTSAATCSLYGYPGASFVTGVGGQQVGAAAARNSIDPVTLVTLPPGGQANALLSLHDAGAYPPAQCQPTKVSWLRIYPPGDYGSVYVQYPAQTCANRAEVIMAVTPVRSGAGAASP
jgi:hypothetical protein